MIVVQSACGRSQQAPSAQSASPAEAGPRPGAQGDEQPHASDAVQSGAQAAEAHAHPPSDAGAAHAHGYAKDFSAADAYAAHFDAPGRDAWQKPAEVVRLLELRVGTRVADLGAGTGYFLGPLSAAVGATGRVLALDTEPNMVRHMERRAKASGWANVDVRRVAANDPALEAESLERILIVNTWHHISDRQRYAAKLLRALRSGGFVMVVDYTRESDLGPPRAHRLPPEQVVRELAAAGLTARIVEESLPKQYIVVGARR